MCSFVPMPATYIYMHVCICIHVCVYVHNTHELLSRVYTPYICGAAAVRFAFRFAAIVVFVRRCCSVVSRNELAGEISVQREGSRSMWHACAGHVLAD